MKIATLRKKIYNLVDHDLDWFDWVVISLVLVNIFFMILGTVDNLDVKYGLLFDSVEIGTIIIFTIEYLLRVWVIVENPDYSHPIKGRLKYIFSWEGIIEFLAFGLFYLRFIGITWQLVQVFQAVRLTKVLRYVSTFQVIVDIIRAKRKILISSMFLVFFILTMASIAMYRLEHQAQPDKFDSIPSSMYWAVITMTSVGYGDISPVTPIGRVIGSFVAILGIMSFAIPIGIIASGFVEYFDTVKKKKDKWVSNYTCDDNVIE
jgi:voltage-gated potassium channel